MPGLNVRERVDEDPGLDDLVGIFWPVPVLDMTLTQSDHVVDRVAPHLLYIKDQDYSVADHPRLRRLRGSLPILVAEAAAPATNTKNFSPNLVCADSLKNSCACHRL